MRKILIAIYGISGVAICVLALIGFVVDGGVWPQRVAMLAGLLIFGGMFIGGALAMWRRPVAFARRKRQAGTWQLGLATAALLVGTIMVGWVMWLHPITWHAVAMAWTVLAYLVCSWLEAFEARRQGLSQP